MGRQAGADAPKYVVSRVLLSSRGWHRAGRAGRSDCPNYRDDRTPGPPRPARPRPARPVPLGPLSLGTCYPRRGTRPKPTPLRAAAQRVFRRARIACADGIVIMDETAGLVNVANLLDISAEALDAALDQPQPALVDARRRLCERQRRPAMSGLRSCRRGSRPWHPDSPEPPKSALSEGRGSAKCQLECGVRVEARHANSGRLLECPAIPPRPATGSNASG